MTRNHCSAEAANDPTYEITFICKGRTNVNGDNIASSNASNREKHHMTSLLISAVSVLLQQPSESIPPLYETVVVSRKVLQWSESL